MSTVELAYRRQGKGPPLLCLHGLLGSGRNWVGIATALADRFDVILPDLRNHGTSPWADEVTYPAMAADIAALLDRLGQGRVHLLGHSMGGKVAMTLAATRPELLARLVVVDVAPVSYRHGHEDFVRAMMGRDRNEDQQPVHLVCDAAFVRKYAFGAVPPLAWERRRAVRSG